MDGQKQIENLKKLGKKWNAHVFLNLKNRKGSPLSNCNIEKVKASTIGQSELVSILLVLKPKLDEPESREVESHAEWNREEAISDHSSKE